MWLADDAAFDDSALASFAYQYPRLKQPRPGVDLAYASISTLAPLRGLPLTSLGIRDVDQINSLAPLQGMPLAFLGLREADGITSLEPLVTLENLEELDLADANGIASLEPLRALRLTALWLSKTDVMGFLAVEKGRPTNVAIDDHGYTPNLEVLHGMPLSFLDLSGASGLTSLEPLSSLKELRTLDLSGLSNLGHIDPLRGLSLTNLNLDGVWRLASLEPLAGMRLAELSLQNATAINDLEPLRGMPITVLNLAGAIGIHSLEPLWGMPLTSLNVSGATGITSLEPLKGLILPRLSAPRTRCWALSRTEGRRRQLRGDSDDDAILAASLPSTKPAGA